MKSRLQRGGEEEEAVGTNNIWDPCLRSLHLPYIHRILGAVEEKKQSPCQGWMSGAEKSVVGRELPGAFNLIVLLTFVCVIKE